MPGFVIDVAELQGILPLRNRYLDDLQDFALQEEQIQANGCRFLSVKVDEQTIGYGAFREVEGRRRIVEFYLLAEYRNMSRAVFKKVVNRSEATSLITRTNDDFLSSLFYDYCENSSVSSLHFCLATPTNFTFPNLAFRPAEQADKEVLHRLFCDPESRPFHWTDETWTQAYLDDGVFWVLHRETEFVGVGVLYKTIYQPQFVDLGMLVAPSYRQMGYGSFIVQELTKICDQQRLTPAVGCIAGNEASRRTLERAGYFPYHRYLVGDIRDCSDEAWAV